MSELDYDDEYTTPIKGRLLVVDDDQPNRRLLQLLLEEEHFMVDTAASGEECLQMARRIDPEVILLDIRMPGMDGIETCRKLKQSFTTVNIPVLFISGHGDDEPAAIEALRAGGNDFVSKDTSRPVFVARVMSQIAIGRAHARLREMAIQDELTGVLTRRAVLDSLRRDLVVRSADGAVVCLLIDLDGLKRINDEQGHGKGDQVLRDVATVLQSHYRPPDLVGRFEGDEFVVVRTNAHPDSVASDAEAIRAKISGLPMDVSASVGIATLPPAEPEPDEDLEQVVQALLEQAGDALIEAKDGGRDRIVIAAK